MSTPLLEQTPAERAADVQEFSERQRLARIAAAERERNAQAADPAFKSAASLERIELLLEQLLAAVNRLHAPQ